jgi:hypothetical protein
MRFRLRTLLAAFIAVIVTVGLARWWYNLQVRRHVLEVAAMTKLAARGGVASWTYDGPALPGMSKAIERHTDLTQVSHLWCENIDSLDPLASRIAELARMKSIQLLARQIVPRLARSVDEDPLLRALGHHPSLKQIIVDASIRGAPVELDAPPYTREDLRKLEAALPNVEIIWIEVN